MKCRITFSVSGENFRAQECNENLFSNQVQAVFASEYPKSLSFYHPDEFCEYWDEAYEKAFLDFIIKNIAFLARYGADDFSIFTEMYIESNEQCNFSILGEGFFPYIWKYNIGLPVSVYILEDETAE